ncbi:MAG: response regulator transcription factor [Bacteroidetes bacterium]|nr:response regulator transcription factor [Bacteroidota bacterium]
MKSKVRKDKILLVEDDPNLSLLIQDFLEMSGFNVVLCNDGLQGYKAFLHESFDLCILDIMMPKKDGFSLAMDIRAKDQNIPIIFLTAKSMKEDKITGFKIGCDDYLTKPFITEELLYRIKAILKRCKVSSREESENTQMQFIIGKYIFDFSNLTLKFEDSVQNLTKKEAELLKLLCMNKNQILTRETALKSVWGDDDYFIGRSMDVFITKLRKYLKEDPAVSINNIHGTGFRFTIED